MLDYDKEVAEYIKNLRIVGGIVSMFVITLYIIVVVIKTLILMAAKMCKFSKMRNIIAANISCLTVPITAAIGILSIATGQNLHPLLAIDPSVSLARYLPNLHSYSHAAWCTGSRGISDHKTLDSVATTA